MDKNSGHACGSLLAEPESRCHSLVPELCKGSVKLRSCARNEALFEDPTVGEVRTADGGTTGVDLQHLAGEAGDGSGTWALNSDLVRDLEDGRGLQGPQLASIKLDLVEDLREGRVLGSPHGSEAGP